MKKYDLWVRDKSIIKGKDLQPEAKTLLDKVYLTLHTDCKFDLTFLDCTLQRVILNPFELHYGNLKNCIFKECIIFDADIEFCIFNNVIFSHTTFNKTLFDRCVFNNCVFNSCSGQRRMTNCRFYNCTFRNETKDLLSTCAIDETCVLSQCRGIASPSDYLNEYFKRNESDTGYIVYKTFGSVYSPCKEWDISPGSIIYENCDMNRHHSCGYGINVAPIEWIKNNVLIDKKVKDKDIWRCEILDRWLADVCVPYGTDGKIRCNKLRLIEIVE